MRLSKAFPPEDISVGRSYEVLDAGLDGGVQPLLTRGEFPLSIERVE